MDATALKKSSPDDRRLLLVRSVLLASPDHGYRRRKNVGRTRIRSLGADFRQHHQALQGAGEVPHVLEGFDADTVTLQNPYYETEIGIGFAGYCLEALTIIALFSRVMEQLVDVAEEGTRPDQMRCPIRLDVDRWHRRAASTRQS